MTTKPLLIGNSASLPNYGEFLRKHASVGYPQASSQFAGILTEQNKLQASQSAASPTIPKFEQTHIVMPETKNTPTETVKLPQAGISLANIPIELKKMPIGITPPSIALDMNSLQTLVNLSKKIENGENPSSRSTRLRHTSQREFAQMGKLGSLSAQYESGSAGIAAIGYDKVGGTSYGKYQIASRVGTLDDFVKFLKTEAPDIAQQLAQAGPANTGSRKGKMPEVWKNIAEREPERFGQLQEQFIHESHFTPVVEALKDCKLDINSDAMKQVIWSTAVHHGANGAKEIFKSALENSKSDSPKDLISSVYKLRAEKFTSSNSDVRASVQNRLMQEKNQALSMLG